MTGKHNYLTPSMIPLLIALLFSQANGEDFWTRFRRDFCVRRQKTVSIEGLPTVLSQKLYPLQNKNEITSLSQEGTLTYTASQNGQVYQYRTNTSLLGALPGPRVTMNYTQDSTHVWVNLLGRDSLFYSDGRLEEERHLEFDMGEYTSIVSLSPTGQVFDYAIERHSLTNSVMGTVPLKTIVQEAVRTLSRRKN